MTQNITTHTLRSLAFQVDKDRLTGLKRKDKFRDLANAGSMLNAILFATNRGVPYQLAKFAVQKELTRETLYMTGGLLFNALAMSEAMAAKYHGSHAVRDMGEVVRSFREFEPPEVLVDTRSFGLFKLYTSPDIFGLVDDPKLTGRQHLFAEKQRHIFGIPVAKFADPADVSKEGFAGLEGELHISLESLISTVTEDIVLALESFICGMAKNLGLEPIKQKSLVMAAEM